MKSQGASKSFMATIYKIWMLRYESLVAAFQPR
jgi:hypothetical protein